MKPRKVFFCLILIMLVGNFTFAAEQKGINKSPTLDEIRSFIADEPKRKAERANRLKEERKKNDEYLAKIELYEVSAKYFETYANKKTAGVVFKLKNNGDKTVDEVDVIFYFMDAKGTVIHEKTFSPVRTWASSDRPPFRPNYIWQLDPGQLLKVKGMPSEWHDGSFKAEITRIKLAK